MASKALFRDTNNPCCSPPGGEWMHRLCWCGVSETIAAEGRLAGTPKGKNRQSCDS